MVMWLLRKVSRRDHVLHDVKNQVILIAIAVSCGRVGYRSAFPLGIRMQHDENVGWLQGCHCRPLFRRTVPGIIVMAAMTYQCDHMRLNSNPLKSSPARVGKYSTMVSPRCGVIVSRGS